MQMEINVMEHSPEDIQSQPNRLSINGCPLGSDDTAQLSTCYKITTLVNTWSVHVHKAFLHSASKHACHRSWWDHSNEYYLPLQLLAPAFWRNRLFDILSMILLDVLSSKLTIMIQEFSQIVPSPSKSERSDTRCLALAKRELRSIRFITVWDHPSYLIRCWNT